MRLLSSRTKPRLADTQAVLLAIASGVMCTALGVMCTALGVMCTALGVLRTVLPGRLARHLDLSRLSGPALRSRCFAGRHQFCSAPPFSGTPTIERLGARWGAIPGARDERVARLDACVTRRDLPDVRRHPAPPGRAGRPRSCRPLGSSSSSSRPAKRT